MLRSLHINYIKSVEVSFNLHLKAVYTFGIIKDQYHHLVITLKHKQTNIQMLSYFLFIFIIFIFFMIQQIKPSSASLSP